MKIGDKIRMSTTHSDGSIVSYKATVVKLDGANVWLEIPQRVRSLPFPPYDGKRYALFAAATMSPHIVK